MPKFNVYGFVTLRVANITATDADAASDYFLKKMDELKILAPDIEYVSLDDMDIDTVEGD